MRRALAFLCIAIVPAVILSAQATDPAVDQSAMILVLPFDIPPGSTAMWIGRAAQEDLMTDLTQATLARIKAPSEPRPARDADVALKLAKEFNATVVIYGQAQVVDLNVRLTGQVLDVASGRTLGALKVTGPLSDLFQIEDALARETFAALPQTMLKPEVLDYLRESSMAAQQAPSQPGESPIEIVAVSSEPQQLRYAPVSTPFSPIVPPYSPAFDPLYGGYDSYGYLGAGSFYPGVYPNGYFGTSYPFGWIPAGGVVISNTNSGFGNHRDFHHRSDAGGNRWAGQGGRRDSSAGASGTQVVDGTNDSVPVRFSWGGAAGVTAGAGVQFAPRANGFSPSAFPRGGFAPMAGPRFNGFGNQVRGGTFTSR